jgi:hypothetical protein
VFLAQTPGFLGSRWRKALPCRSSSPGKNTHGGAIGMTLINVTASQNITFFSAADFVLV